MPNEAERRLAAILSADIAGYSRLMADDEDLTVRTLQAWREQVGALVNEHRGRLVDFTGDNFLAEFRAARDAVECAVEVQSVIEARNQVAPEARRMRFRIGAHLGDIRVEGDRLFGDGVNVAARLQAIAEPGGLCLSAAVVEQVRGKVALDFEDLGEQVLKNLPAPVRAFRVRLGTPSVQPMAVAPSGTKGRSARRRIGAGLAVVAAAIAVMVGVTIRNTEGEAPAARAAVPEVAQPSAAALTVAVLPFINLANDPGQEYFSEGISEDILNGLARNQRLVVRAWRSSFLFKAQDADPRAIADQLDVAYLVNGSVRRQDDRIRVMARLTDVASNTDIWSDRYEAESSDLFAVQDQITASIVGALGEQFSGSGRKSVDPAAYDAYLMGRYYYNRLQADRAEAEFLRAIELSPAFADAHAALPSLYGTMASSSPPNRKELRAKADEFLTKALELDPEQPLALAGKAMYMPTQAGIDTLNTLVRRYPNDPELVFFYSALMRRIGDIDREAALTDRMVALDPLSPIARVRRADSHLAAGRIDAALQDLLRAEQMGLPSPVYLTQTALLSGDAAAARLQLDRPSQDWAVLTSTDWRSIHAGFLAALAGDAEAVGRELAPIETRIEGQASYVRFHVALLEGDVTEAVELYRTAFREGEWLALGNVQGLALQRRLFPDYFASEGYQAMLRDFELDAESVARLSVPPLPFEVATDL